MSRPIKKIEQLSYKKKFDVTPGSLKSHYAPESKLRLNVSNPETNELFLGFGEMPSSAIGLSLSTNKSLNEAATNFFAALTDLDRMAKSMGLKQIAVAPIPKNGLGRTINDRLKKAAAPPDFTQSR